MNDPQAAQAPMETVGEAGGQMESRLVAIHSMQIDFSLDDPSAAAQIPQDADG